MTLELPFTSLSYITPHFRPHEPHLAILALESKSRDQEWEFTCDFREQERILFEFSRFFTPSKFVSEEKPFQVWKLKLLTQFSNTRHSFIKLQMFSFIEPHETNYFIMECKNLFSSESHEIHPGIEWDLFLHDLEWKSYHMKSSLIFQFLVKFSSLVHDFGCLALLSSLWV